MFAVGAGWLGGSGGGGGGSRANRCFVILRREQAKRTHQHAAAAPRFMNKTYGVNKVAAPATKKNKKNAYEKEMKLTGFLAGASGQDGRRVDGRFLVDLHMENKESRGSRAAADAPTEVGLNF